MSRPHHVIVDEETVPQGNRDARRGTDQPMPPIPASRGIGKSGMFARGDIRGLAPNDMRPREVDRQKIKAARKRSAANRRKRK